MSWDLRKPAQLAARRRASLLLSHPEGVMLVRALLVGLGSASAYNMMPSRMAGSVRTLAHAAAPAESSRRAAAYLKRALLADGVLAALDG